MPDLTDTETRSTRPPRLRRARPVAPPLEVVAVAGLELDPSSPVVAFLRAVPQVADRMVRVEALRRLAQLVGNGIGVTEAERLVGLRYGVSPRQLRRWRRGR